MDGNFTPRPLAEPNWIRPALVPPPLAAASPARSARASLFLQRDLSDEAFRKPVEPTFTQADLAAARQQGYEAGHAAGTMAAVSSREAHQAAAEEESLQVIAAAMTKGCHLAADVTEAAATSLAKALIAAMNAAMPDLIQRSALNEVTAMLALVLPGLSREPSVRVEVPNEMVAYIEATCASLVPDHSSKIQVMGENSMTPGEARVRWNAGQARRRPSEVWQAVMNAFHPLLTTIEPRDSENGE